jgi:hypothetical protein
MESEFLVDFYDDAAFSSHWPTCMERQNIKYLIHSTYTVLITHGSKLGQDPITKV